jgi:dTDP-4-amino-4,6-dideoxygalactose transaminase
MSMEATVPLFDVARALAPVRDRALATFERLMGSAEFTLGQDLAAFEREFARFCGVKECVGVSDGTNAIRLGLLALGLERGQRVVTVPNTFVATVEAIAAAGGRPVLADVDPVSRCIDVDALAAALDEQTAIAIPVHLYGRVAAMPQILDVCGRKNVRVLEDAAQAHGAVAHGRRAGAWGDAAAFSFYPTKNLGAWGDGGAVVCQRLETANLLRSLRHHGSAPGEPNSHLRAGDTARLDNLQAALLTLRLERLEQENEERRRAAARYRELLAGLPVGLPADDEPGAAQVYHLFVVEVPERDRVMAALRRAGIGTAVHYPTPIHLQPAWRGLGYAPGDFPIAERLARTSLSLPCFPGITESELERVADALAAALERSS